jgi:hypothetical protein
MSPAALSAVAGDSSVTLNWQPPVNTGGFPVVGYAIEYAQIGYIDFLELHSVLESQVALQTTDMTLPWQLIL